MSKSIVSEFLMNVTNKNIIVNHKQRIELFISKFEQVVAENKKLKEDVLKQNEQLGNYKQIIKTKEDKIKELEQKIDELQLAGAFSSSSADVKEARQNISRLVREIDKCIALLND